MKPIRKTFFQRVDTFPPVLVRLLARSRKHGPPLSDTEIARRGQLSPFQVTVLSESPDWHAIPFGTMRSFIAACGVDFCNGRQMERIDDYLRSKPTWQYLRKSPDWPRYEKLMRIYAASIRKPKA